jgi:hypothetical protein
VTANVGTLLWLLSTIERSDALAVHVVNLHRIYVSRVASVSVECTEMLFINHKFQYIGESPALRCLRGGKL